MIKKEGGGTEETKARVNEIVTAITKRLCISVTAEHCPPATAGARATAVIAAWI